MDKQSGTLPAPDGVSADELARLDEYIDSLDETDGALIEILHEAQGIFGYLSRDVQLYIARRLDIPGAMVSGVVSFYSYFTMKPPGKHTISVCTGTACFVRGADKVLEAFRERLGVEQGGTTGDGLFTLKGVRCVGACGLAPVVTVGDKVFGRVTPDDIDGIIKAYGKE